MRESKERTGKSTDEKGPKKSSHQLQNVEDIQLWFQQMIKLWDDQGNLDPGYFLIEISWELLTIFKVRKCYCGFAFKNKFLSFRDNITIFMFEVM